MLPTFDVYTFADFVFGAIGQLCKFAAPGSQAAGMLNFDMLSVGDLTFGPSDKLLIG